MRLTISKRSGVIKINCDMCGNEGQLFKTDVEGSILNLCKDCSRFGKVISAIRIEKKETKKGIKTEKQEIEEESVLSIVPTYGDIIKRKREQLGIKQEDFAKKINEKMSLIHKIETNQFEPGIDLARKIEKFLHIKLMEQEKIKPNFQSRQKSEGFTIGDFIKIKK